MPSPNNVSVKLTKAVLEDFRAYKNEHFPNETVNAVLQALVAAGLREPPEEVGKRLGRRIVSR